MITVFTPAYNRAHLLPRLYDSLCKQTFRDFEWVIVDDGSVDDTRSLSLSLPKREGTFFPIRYFYQENGGKHRAINRGVKEAKGDLFFIADSDDWLPENALERVSYHFQHVMNDPSIGGVCGVKTLSNNKRVGMELPFELMDLSPLDYWFKYKIHGDSAEVFRTEVLRQFPFPEIEGEKFCPEALVWYRIAKAGYKLRYFNESIYTCEYLPDGLTAHIIKIRVKSPIAAAMTYWELYHSPVDFKTRMYAGINFWRFYFHIKTPYHFKKKPYFFLAIGGKLANYLDKKKIYG